MHGYCRLSRDEDKENYSSIEEQKRIIKEYVSSRNWIINDKDFYIDDNVSGYTFNRPEFTKMLEKVKGGKIDVVIAKDLSRIGRNNGKVLVLIDEFKDMQKNMILVSDVSLFDKYQVVLKDENSNNIIVNISKGIEKSRYDKLFEKVCLAKVGLDSVSTKYNGKEDLKTIMEEFLCS